MQSYHTVKHVWLLKKTHFFWQGATSHQLWYQDSVRINSLPLQAGRNSHACGWFIDSSGRRVSKKTKAWAWKWSTILQINIVAGGILGDNFVDTVEVNVAGEKIWRFGVPLSNKMAAMKGLTILEKFYITGGYFGRFTTNTLTNEYLQNVHFLRWICWRQSDTSIQFLRQTLKG